ncbi:MAG: DUF354 domain-containing protein [Candidatus Cloacimonadaceae bacterium]|nr:DUF354 domain-containing protein [Candidatus Cloacimonadaceae bacterium]
MNILIDVGHPAHVHNFRNLYHDLIKRHEIVVTCKSVPIIIKLLKTYNIPYIDLGEKGSHIADKFIRQIGFNRKIRAIIHERNIDVAMGLSFSIIYATKLTKATSLLFDDDDQEPQPLTAKFASPFADFILSPDVLSYEKLKNALYYPGYHEIAYLHPRVYKPNSDLLSKYGIRENEKYFVLRFSAFKAHHDIHASGMSVAQKHTLVNMLSEYGRVFITMESEIQAEFEQYRMPIEPHEMHDFLHYSQLLVCDGQTMCTEAAMLGVPSFRCNSFVGRVAVLEEEEKKYGLTYAFLPRQFDWMLYKIEELIKTANYKETWQLKRQRLLENKIDVTAFWAWIIDNYPDSLEEIKKPNFDFGRFK